MVWKYKKRMIAGKMRKVKVHRKRSGQEIVRVIGKKNYSDRTRTRRRRK